MFTSGEMLFYGGILGMAVVLLVSVIVFCVMSKSRKRLRRKLDNEYGNITKSK